MWNLSWFWYSGKQIVSSARQVPLKTVDNWCAFLSSFSLFIQPLKVVRGPQAGNPRTELLQSERSSNVQNEKCFGWRFAKSFVKYSGEQSLRVRWSSWRKLFKSSQTGDVKEKNWVLVVEAEESEEYVSLSAEREKGQ